MGQPIEVTARPGGRPEVMFFEINRSLTGMRIEQYSDPATATGDRWVDEMARRLAALGVSRLTIYSSSIVAEAPDWTGLRERAEEVIRELYTYYVDGKIPEGDYTGDEETSDESGAESGEAAEAEASS